MKKEYLMMEVLKVTFLTAALSDLILYMRTNVFPKLDEDELYEFMGQLKN